jgi:hypothetical protein
MTWSSMISHGQDARRKRRGLFFVSTSMPARTELNHAKWLAMINKCMWSKFTSLRVAAPGTQTTVAGIALGAAHGVNGQN